MPLPLRLRLEGPEGAATAGLQPSAGLPTETCQLFTFFQYVTVSHRNHGLTQSINSFARIAPKWASGKGKKKLIRADLTVFNSGAMICFNDTVEEERTDKIQGIVWRKLRLTTTLIRFSSPPFRRYVHKNYSTQCQLQCHMQNRRIYVPTAPGFSSIWIETSKPLFVFFITHQKKNTVASNWEPCAHGAFKISKDMAQLPKTVVKGGAQRGERERRSWLYSEHLEMSEDSSASRRGAALRFVSRCLAQGSCVEGYSGWYEHTM